MSYKFAFSIKKCAFCCTFFWFRAQSYEKISYLHQISVLNKIKQNKLVNIGTSERSILLRLQNADYNSINNKY